MADERSGADRLAGIAAARARQRSALARLEGQLDEVRALRRGEWDDDEHDPDGVPLSEEWSRLTGLRDAAVRTLDELDSAESEARSTVQPRCARCGTPIPLERLAVRPQARTCVECAHP